MNKIFNVCCVPVANSSDICLIARDSMRTISSNNYLELILLEKSIKDLTI